MLPTQGFSRAARHLLRGSKEFVLIRPREDQGQCHLVVMGPECLPFEGDS